jgi:hypothetical protein
LYNREFSDAIVSILHCITFCYGSGTFPPGRKLRWLCIGGNISDLNDEGVLKAMAHHYTGMSRFGGLSSIEQVEKANMDSKKLPHNFNRTSAVKDFISCSQGKNVATACVGCDMSGPTHTSFSTSYLERCQDQHEQMVCSSEKDGNIF